MVNSRDKSNPVSVKGKVLAGFFFALIAIMLALGITHFAFRTMLSTVDELSEPNEKLTALHTVFQEITTLDQLQRAEAIRNPYKPYRAFLSQSKTVAAQIDTILAMPWDTAQHSRISEMKQVLKQRDKLFFSYLRLKLRLAANRQYTERLDTLAVILDQGGDTSVVTTQKKTTTTYWKDSTVASEKDKKPARFRLFGKKKNTAATPETQHVKVEEELSVQVDTLAVARQSNALEEVEKIMRELDDNRVSQNRRLQRRELELIHANSLFINQLLGILHEVENEELQQMRKTNQQAGTLFNQSISRISMLLVVFFLVAALLVYLIWIDISKSNYYKEQLERSRDEAEELGQIKQRFLANMSHEIRTPLQSIIGFAEQLRQRPGSPEAAAAIHSSSEHLLHIVNEVLDYSRISSGNFSLAEEAFTLRTLVNEVEEAMRVQSEKKGLTFLLDYEQALDYRLLGDPFRLRQILYNLLGNAIKFTNKGFVRLTVRTVEQPGDTIACTFEVTDTGIGIRPEDLKTIFNQFEQASSLVAEQYGGGSGLGLTIVKSLVEAQRGTVEVSSEPGIGSTFLVQLAFARTTQTVQPAAHAPAPGQLSIFHGKVLLVDDDPMIVRLCGLIFTNNNIPHQLFEEAEKLLNHPPDPTVTHILMDIRMPRINGIELCAALRKKYPRSTRFIALTAHVFAQDRQKLLDGGFDVVLAKPFHEQELLETLGLSAGSQALSEAASAAATPPAALDLSVLKQMTFGDESLLQSVLTQFVEETGDDLQRLEASVQHSDTGILREVVHKLAGRTGQMGAMPLSVRLRALEKRIHEGEILPALGDEAALLQGEVEEMMKSVRVLSDL
ncbi:ATP-binding protein [Parachryseolinea silvisoli]|uniref:ATP-binding protein n=1 Tax=Parachryseolinea silvisoli TaxID=2873601 RepID=UPI002265DE96|nr:ATP-binding protein [Parachryseolinea silvisoli]MCD9014540.1 response regulator [Parachryseolinea silvisoli]